MINEENDTNKKYVTVYHYAFLHMPASYAGSTVTLIEDVLNRTKLDCLFNFFDVVLPDDNEDLRAFDSNMQRRMNIGDKYLFRLTLNIPVSDIQPIRKSSNGASLINTHKIDVEKISSAHVTAMKITNYMGFSIVFAANDKSKCDALRSKIDKFLVVTLPDFQERMDGVHGLGSVLHNKLLDKSRVYDDLETAKTNAREYEVVVKIHAAIYKFVIMQYHSTTDENFVVAETPTFDVLNDVESVFFLNYNLFEPQWIEQKNEKFGDPIQQLVAAISEGDKATVLQLIEAGNWPTADVDKKKLDRLVECFYQPSESNPRLADKQRDILKYLLDNNYLQADHQVECVYQNSSEIDSKAAEREKSFAEAIQQKTVNEIRLHPKTLDGKRVYKAYFLHKAIEYGCLQLARLLLSYGIDRNQAYENGDLASPTRPFVNQKLAKIPAEGIKYKIDSAIRTGNIEKVENFLKNGCVLGLEHIPALYDAFKAEQKSIFALIFSKFSLTPCNEKEAIEATPSSTVKSPSLGFFEKVIRRLMRLINEENDETLRDNLFERLYSWLKEVGKLDEDKYDGKILISAVYDRNESMVKLLLPNYPDKVKENAFKHAELLGYDEFRELFPGFTTATPVTQLKGTGAVFMGSGLTNRCANMADDDKDDNDHDHVYGL